MPEKSPQRRTSGESSTVECYPQFHLTYATDWETSPTEVTIYPAGENDNRTRWISANHRDTVSVERIR